MKRNFIALCALLLAACGSQEPKITLFSNEAFQTEADGKPVGIYTLRAGDVTMQVTNYGARVVSLWTPDRAGDYEDIVLGYETIDRYINNDGERFLGAVVGPYANRIGKRIIGVGRSLGSAGNEVRVPDSYEMPRNAIDLSASKKFGKLEVKAAIRDVLAEKVSFKQFENTGNGEVQQITRQFKPGRSFNVNISYNF